MVRFFKSGSAEIRYVLDSVWDRKSSAVIMSKKLRKAGDNARMVRNSRFDWEVWVRK
jgi:hypothetical protein